jgi:pimeloyl-ACP methyl ester carboxylesterase
MLRNGGIDGPLVLVGHSMGAVFARLYAEHYPAEVQGLVISDHAGRYRITALPATPFGGPAPIPSEQQTVAKLPPAAQRA